MPGLAQQDADDEPFLPGLVARWQDGAGHTSTRLDPQLSFHWTEAPPDPRLDPGAFQATWQGHLLVLARGDYRFSCFGSGEVEMKIGGRVVVARQNLRNEWRESPPVTLAAEPQPLELFFRRTGKDARVVVLWSGPQFGPEPIAPRFLVHARERAVGQDYERGQLLAQALRCGHCHGGERPPPAPALDRVGKTLSRAWLIPWLTAEVPGGPERGEPQAPRRMPALGLAAAQAEAVADWILTAPQPDWPVITPPKEVKPPQRGKKSDPPRAKPSAKIGERLFLTLGCLACHSWRDLGGSGWLGGGDLSHVADKRPANFFAAWLAEPARLNRDHRMPTFALSADERTALSLFLAEQRSGPAKPAQVRRDSAPSRAKGRKLVEQFRCAACHRLPETSAATPAPTKTALAPHLGTASNWQHGCLGPPDPRKQRPGYRLLDRDARALRIYYTSRQGQAVSPRGSADGRLLLAEYNCLACHEREGTHVVNPLATPVLAERLTLVARRYSELAPLVPAMTPPPLTSVGDKLHDKALVEAIARRGQPHRPYLGVRMPRFPLSDEHLHGLIQYLVASDRVPPRAPASDRALDRFQQERYLMAGGRLVSGDGFGCTSCHSVGSVQTPQVQVNARGPDLARLGERIRRPWYDRWVRNPARIIPRMEMPSVQLPVTGVLDDRLDEQLAAVWHVLNVPGFEPPAPNPVRTLRHHGNTPGAAPLVITDLVQVGSRTLVRPFLVGLANRHNVLLDLEAGNLALWAAGDTARQRTRGKNWFWELGGTPVLETGLAGPDLSLIVAGRDFTAGPQGQFVAEADAWQTEGPRLVLHHRLTFDVADPPASKVVTLHVERKLAPTPQGASGFAQELTISPLPGDSRIRLKVLSAKAAMAARRSADGRSVALGDRAVVRIIVMEPSAARFSAEGPEVLLTPDAKGSVRAVLHYLAEIPLDRFPEQPPAPTVAGKPRPLAIAPGFQGERLPLPEGIMPTGLTWRPDGRLVFSSLKGQVFEAIDTDRDGSEDQLVLLADGLPAPYGVYAGPDYVDVSAKHALLRVHDTGKAGRRIEAIASGWGYAGDYHDWAVGLPRNSRGEYSLGIPCQQDKRSANAARFRGTVLRLVPRAPTADDPRRFALVPLSAGHRFPMGLALDHDGELFVTDNQGNYNPFNTLNHVQPAAYFGFINALDRGKLAPPRTPSTIDIPHPWTRSVNGICFLYTPKDLRARLGHEVFGPLEGHLIGCEYDTRRLIRMSLQQVGTTFQGAAYPLSIPPDDLAKGFLGPLVCAISPRGELYVGSIRDSGWGAGNNVGEIVRVRIEPDKLPCGIAEVRATHHGFTIDFFRPVDRELAGQAGSYTIQSYRREATPAYGGPDLDRRTERMTEIVVAKDARRVTLRLAELRPGFVYELRLRNLAPKGGDFHPAEAHYTLHVVPK
jgi:cbb3-type cytochrome oxidase cytochrome c subunit